MRALVSHGYDGIDALTVGDLPAPTAGAGQVLIDVAAAGVNFADTLMVDGNYQERPEPPFAPGLEVAGTVREVGKGVSRVASGDRVIALLDHGGFAEQAVAQEADVFPIPDAMDMTLAAGFPITYGTAHGALRWSADMKAGETLLVHGSAGGVGLAAVEVGKALGARVIATAGSPEKLAVAREHGADETIDYKAENLRERVRELTDGKGVNVVFDPVGGDVFDTSLRVTAWGGRLLVIGFAAGRIPQIPANLLLVKNISAIGVYWGSNRKYAPERLERGFEELFGWYSEGKLSPRVSETFNLEDGTEAMNQLRSRQATGKVVITLR